jgi:glycosyltransferase involved in cell wall biosynthesis
MRIAYITAGAAGMYCGSCLRDNALARALIARGHDILLVPTYTPTKTDEPNVSLSQVFMGGISVYLQNKSALFRHTPPFLDRLLDSPRLLQWASNLAVKTDGAELGSLTVSMLQGESGPNRKEYVKLARWLGESVQPDVVNISNSLLIAAAQAIRVRCSAPIVCSLTGEDLFIEGLSDPWRTEALELLRKRVSDVDAFVTFSQDYAGFMSDLLQIPPSKMFVVPVGISLDGHLVAPEKLASSSGPVIGFLARICPEKGVHLLCDAFRLLREQDKYSDCRLRIAGYVGERDRPYVEQLKRQVAEWGLEDSVDFAGELDRNGKIEFLQSLDLFSVPSICRESKALPVLEAWANRVPVVQPWHSIYAELVNSSQGGVLIPPNDATALAEAIGRLLDNPVLRQELGRRGREAIEKTHNSDRMAEATLAVYQQLVDVAACASPC